MAPLSASAIRAPTSVDEISHMLEHVSTQVDARFSQTGPLLADTLDVINQLIQALNRLSTGLSSETASRTIGNLLTTADDLHALPDRCERRQEHLLRLTKAGEGLRAPLEDMQSLLKYLRVFTLN